MSHTMNKVEESGDYEVMDFEKNEGEDLLFFVRHTGAPQAILRNSVSEARETAVIMNRVLNVYRPGQQG